MHKMMETTQRFKRPREYGVKNEIWWEMLREIWSEKEKVGVGGRENGGGIASPAQCKPTAEGGAAEGMSDFTDATEMWTLRRSASMAASRRGGKASKMRDRTVG